MAEDKIEVDPDRFVLLEAVAKAAEELGISWLLAGAGGRILLLENACGLPTGRATMDLDFGVMVNLWKEYMELKDLICKDKGFKADKSQAQRLRYGQNGVIDLVPFGPIAKPNDKVLWPPEEDVEFNVLGFEEASNTAITLLVNETLEVPVATPQALLLLKFIAWEDRHNEHPGKDAEDIAYILSNGVEIVGEDALFEEYEEALEATGYDLELASARVLGGWMAETCKDRTLKHVLKFIDAQLNQGEDSSLVWEIGKHLYLSQDSEGNALELLQNLRAGFEP